MTATEVAAASPGDDQRIGLHVRRVRRARGLTLVQLAARAELSQPFLSQLETGRARPSVVSLGKIARALGTSTVELLADAPEPGAPAGPAVVRAGEGDLGGYGLGRARLLAHGPRALQPLEFSGANPQLDDPHVHPEDEFVYVLAGRCRIDLGGSGDHVLGVGDAAYVPGGTAHRWCSADGGSFRLLLVKQQVVTG